MQRSRSFQGKFKESEIKINMYLNSKASEYGYFEAGMRYVYAL